MVEVSQVDLLPLHDPVADLDVVGCDLVAEAAGSCVDHHAHLAGSPDPKGIRGLFVVEPGDLLYLHEVVSCPKASDLILSTRNCPLADVPAVRGFEAAPSTNVISSVRPAVNLMDTPS